MRISKITPFVLTSYELQERNEQKRNPSTEKVSPVIGVTFDKLLREKELARISDRKVVKKV